MESLLGDGTTFNVYWQKNHCMKKLMLNLKFAACLFLQFLVGLVNKEFFDRIHIFQLWHCVSFKFFWWIFCISSICFKFSHWGNVIRCVYNYFFIFVLKVLLTLEHYDRYLFWFSRLFHKWNPDIRTAKNMLWFSYNGKIIVIQKWHCFNSFLWFFLHFLNSFVWNNQKQETLRIVGFVLMLITM